jgi:protein-S-isoprenylcysteine O-methyltransferase Ste14
MPVSTDNKLRKTGVTGIAMGVLALLACELPIILALAGMGALSMSASAFKPPIWIELIGITTAIAGLLLLSILAIRIWRKRGSE